MFLLGVLLQIWLVGAVVTIFICLVLDKVYRDVPPSNSIPIAPSLIATGLLRKLK